MSTDGVAIRPSLEADITEITAIYGYHVRHGLASFEEVPPEPDELASRRRDILARGLPYLVAERSGCVLGYCYAAPYRMRSAYRFTLEDGTVVEARGDEEIDYDGEIHTAANLHDALTEGYYGKF